MLIAKYGKGSEKLVKQFEEKFDVKLESEYRDFLIKYNGGETPDTTFSKGRRKETVRYLYGIKTKESIDEQFEYFDFKERGWLPIGTDVFGNYFAIGFAEEDFGQIYFCDHERGYRKSKIAKSFKEFISCCESGIIDVDRMHPKACEKRMIENGHADHINKILRKHWKEQYKHYKKMKQEELVL